MRQCRCRAVFTVFIVVVVVVALFAVFRLIVPTVFDFVCLAVVVPFAFTVVVVGFPVIEGRGRRGVSQFSEHRRNLVSQQYLQRAEPRILRRPALLSFTARWTTRLLCLMVNDTPPLHIGAKRKPFAWQ